MAWEKFKYAETDTVMPALIMCIDEYAQFVDDVPRSQMRLADELQANIQKITRLGRSAHVHVIIATQSASSNLFPPSLKNNVSERFICGRVESNISRMAIDSEEGESLPLVPGSYLGYSKGETQPFQGYYTSTKKILALGTVKPGYDPETGLEITDEEEFDFSKPPEDISDDTSDNDSFFDNDDDESNNDTDDTQDFFNPSDNSDSPFDSNNFSNFLDDDDEESPSEDSFEINLEDSTSDSDEISDDDEISEYPKSFNFNLNNNQHKEESSQPKQPSTNDFKLNVNKKSSENKPPKGSITIE